MNTIHIKWHSMYADQPVEVDVPLGELSIDSDIDDILGRIFRCCNRVDGSSIEVVPDGYPSMSAGDVVFVNGQSWFCAPIGWKIVENIDDLNKYINTPIEDRIFGSPFFDSNGKMIRRFKCV